MISTLATCLGGKLLKHVVFVSYCTHNTSDHYDRVSKNSKVSNSSVRYRHRCPQLSSFASLCQLIQSTRFIFDRQAIACRIVPVVLIGTDRKTTYAMAVFSMRCRCCYAEIRPCLQAAPFYSIPMSPNQVASF